ncbi:MAG: hypothetical protein Fur0042_12590 [Cyanophyceae cyanobacterium]
MGSNQKPGEGKGHKKFRSQDPTTTVRVPLEYKDQVSDFIRWLDETTYPRVEVDPISYRTPKNQ